MTPFNSLNVILADATTTAPAATSAAPVGQPQSSPISFIFPMLLILVIMYVLMIRPDSQRRKRQAQMIDTLKSGDKVVTSSGIIGVVTGIKDKTVSLRSADAKMEILKSAVTEIIDRDGEEKSAS